MRKFDALPVARNCRNLDDSRLIKISQAENRGIRCLSTNDSQCNAGSLCQKFDGLWRPRKRQISTSVPSFSIFRRFRNVSKRNDISNKFYTSKIFLDLEARCETTNEKNIKKIRFSFFFCITASSIFINIEKNFNRQS